MLRSGQKLHQIVYFCGYYDFSQIIQGFASQQIRQLCGMLL